VGKKVEKQIVIPLIKNNNWVPPELSDEKEDEEMPAADADTKPRGKAAAGGDSGKSLTALAAEALLDQSSTQKKKAEAVIEHIPLLVQNKVPGIDKLDNDTDKFRYDVAMRPAESTIDDYDRVPIGAFGKVLSSSHAHVGVDVGVDVRVGVGLGGCSAVGACAKANVESVVFRASCTCRVCSSVWDGNQGLRLAKLTKSQRSP